MVFTKKTLKLIAFFLLFLFLVSCENSIKEVERISKPPEVAIETIKGVKMLYSDSGQVRIELKAPISLRYKTDTPYVAFPEGIDMRFFNHNLTTNSTLHANYAIRYEKDQQIILRDSIIWRHKRKKEKLESEELIWDERAKKIRSDKFVRITTEKESLWGYGFEANQDFDRYKIKNVKGHVRVNPTAWQK